MTPPLVCGDSCVLFVCTLSMTGKSTLYKRRGHFILSMPIAPVSSSRQNEYDAFELDEENSFPEELEQKYFGLSDEYNPDDFESDEFEDATEDSWGGGY